MRCFDVRHLLLFLCCCVAVGGSLAVAQETLVVLDDFEDNRFDTNLWNQDPIVTSPGLLDTFETIELIQANGVLTVNNSSKGLQHAHIANLDEDAVIDEPGEFVQVTVSVPVGPADSCIFMGLSMTAVADQVPGDRSDSVRCGIRGDGFVGVQVFRGGGNKISEPMVPIEYTPGDTVSFRIMRPGLDDETGLEAVHFFYRLDDVEGAEWTLFYEFVSCGRSSFASGLPKFPGLMVGDGLCDYSASFDNFAVGIVDLLLDGPAQAGECADLPVNYARIDCTATGAGASLSWTNRGDYDAIKVLRYGIEVASLPGDATSYDDPDTSVLGARHYSIRAEAGTNRSWASCVTAARERAPTNLSCQRNGSNVNLSWGNTSPYDSLLLFRNEELIAALPGDQAFFADSGVASATANYELIAIAGSSRLEPTARCSAGGDEPRVIVLDDFNDEVFNADGGFAEPFQSGDPERIALDEEANEGKLTVTISEGGGQGWEIMRTDDHALDRVGEYAEVTVAYNEANTESNCGRIGMHFQAVPAADFPGGRADTFKLGLESNGRVRLHGFRSFPQQGVQNDEYTDPAHDIKPADMGGYVHGDAVTIRMTRSGAREFTVNYGVNGPPEMFAFAIEVPDGPPLPIYPGIYCDNGTCNWNGTWDNFVVGSLDPDCVGDEFDDEVFNADGQWVEPFQSGDPERIALDEEANEGELTVTISEGGGSGWNIMRGGDETIEVIGAYAEVTVRYIEAVTDSNCGRIGMHFQSVSTADFPGGRADTFCMGLESNGRVRLHGFRSFPQAGIQNDEYTDPAHDIKPAEEGGYVNGDLVTMRLTHTASREFTVDYGVNGPVDRLAFVITVPEGPPLPIYPGLHIDNGTCNFTATYESFEVCTPPPPCGPTVVDDFDDEVFNADGTFVEPFQSGDPERIALDEEANEGELTITISEGGGSGWNIMQAADADILDEIGKMAQVTVRYIEAVTDSNCGRVGMHFQSVSTADFPGGRADTFCMGLESNGRVRLHGFRSFPQAGIQNDEYTDPAHDIKPAEEGGYVHGDEVTMRLTRTGSREFTVDYGVNGPPDRLAFVINVPDGPPLPIYAGLHIDNGTCNFTAAIDDFIVGCPPAGDGVGPFLRGDCDQDGQNTGTPTDAIFLLNFLFAGGPEPRCRAACDYNGDGEVAGTPTDALYYLNFNFLGGPAMAAPLTVCATSTAPGDVALGCADPAGCR
jgi:hypothetical protein